MNEKAYMEMAKKEYEAPRMTEKQLEDMKRSVEKAKMENRRDAKKKNIWKKGAAAAAAVILILPNTSATAAYAMGQIPVFGELVQMVTLREYQYQDDRNQADIHVQGIDASAAEQGALQQSAAAINEEIQQIADGFIREFEENLQAEGVYQNIGISSEIIGTAEGYFTLKLTCYQVSGSGTQWDHYYTIDTTTGERLQLRELFLKDADYITPISENIRQQMAERMQKDENEIYWLNEEVEEWNFNKITDETAFYINEKGNIVISFDEGEVAPMYMGVVTFEIPAEAVSDIRK